MRTLLQDTETNRRALLPGRYQRFVQSLQRKRWQWLIGLILGVLVYSYIASRLWRDWQSFDLAAFQLRYSLLGLSWLAQAMGILVAMWTWALLMRQMGYVIPFKRHVKVYTATNLARRLPGLVWWVVGRAYMYDRNGVSKLETSAGAMLEMVLTTTAALSIAIVTSVVAGSPLQKVSPVVLLALLAVLVVLLHPRLFEIARRRLRTSATIPRIKWHQLLLLFGYEVIVVALGGIALYMMIAAIYQATPAVLIAAIQGWALTVVSGSLLFWLPFDFGLSSGLLAVILGAFMPTPVALVVVVAWRFWAGVCELIWGLFGLIVGSPGREPVGE